MIDLVYGKYESLKFVTRSLTKMNVIENCVHRRVESMRFDELPRNRTSTNHTRIKERLLYPNYLYSIFGLMLLDEWLLLRHTINLLCFVLL